jgi:hypothetical protein
VHGVSPWPLCRSNQSRTHLRSCIVVAVLLIFLVPRIFTNDHRGSIRVFLFRIENWMDDNKSNSRQGIRIPSNRSVKNQNHPGLPNQTKNHALVGCTIRHPSSTNRKLVVPPPSFRLPNCYYNKPKCNKRGNHRIISPPAFHTCASNQVAAVTEHKISVPSNEPAMLATLLSRELCSQQTH